MGNVVEFKPKVKVVSETPKESVTEKTNAEPVVIAGRKVEIAQPATSDLSTAALVVQALGFYAQQGWDGGMKARAALEAMQVSINTQTSSVPQ